MSSILGISQNTALSSAAASSRSTTEELRNNFMTMLITQLKNQDPLNPLENNELTSQLAQINTVSGIEALNETLSGINKQIEAGQSLQAAALIGRGVLVPGERLLVGEEGASTPFGIEVSKPMGPVTAQVIGPDGQIAYSVELKSLKLGVNTFSWDGILPDGEVAPPGAYRVELIPTEVGDIDSFTILNYALVSGISRVDGQPRLDLGGLADPVALDQVRQIL